MIANPRQRNETAADYAQRVLDRTERHPDAPTAVSMYLRALLELAVAQAQPAKAPAPPRRTPAKKAQA